MGKPPGPQEATLQQLELTHQENQQAMFELIWPELADEPVQTSEAPDGRETEHTA